MNNTNENTENLLEILNNLEDIIYVADPDTYNLEYVNGAFKKIWGSDVIGKKCYKVLQNLDSPCDFCTNNLILGENLGKTHIWEFQNKVTRKWFRCMDKAIKWSDGRSLRIEYASDINEMKVMQLKLDKKSLDLIERNKELNCVYEIIIVASDLSQEDEFVYSQIPEILQKSWQYPEITEVQLDINGQIYSTKNYKDTKWMQTVQINFMNKNIGEIKVVYTEEKDESFEGPFIKEERNLLNTVSKELSKYYFKKKTLRDLEATKNSLEARVQEQTKEILELSIPILPLWDDILVATLIGQITSERANILMERLLDAISERDAKSVIIDITGVPTIDTQTAQYLIETISASMLLGTQVIMTGIRPEIARTIVHLGIEMSEIKTLTTLTDGLKYAIKNNLMK
jgi:anti-anti-sigma regulatory factor